MIGWPYLSDLHAAWDDPPTIPYSERCWLCQTRRIADGSKADLCEECRDRLRGAA